MDPRDNADMMIAFASIDPHKGKMGAREARRLIEQEGIKGFKFHPTVQGYHPYDRMAWPIYEVINEFECRRCSIPGTVASAAACAAAGVCDWNTATRCIWTTS